MATMAPAYTMDTFLDDVRETFATTSDPMAQAQAVADNLKTLINTPGWLEEMLDLPEEGGYGPKSLHLEEEAGHPLPGFWLMASVQEDGRDKPAPRPRQRLGGLRRVRRLHRADQVALVLPRRGR